MKLFHVLLAIAIAYILVHLFFALFWITYQLVAFACVAALVYFVIFLLRKCA